LQIHKNGALRVVIGHATVASGALLGRGEGRAYAGPWFENLLFLTLDIGNAQIPRRCG
jgi:hypothetical protein